MWKDLLVTGQGAAAGPKGMLTLSRDPRESEGKAARIQVTVPGQPGVAAELSILPRYDRPFTAAFLGEAGAAGKDGMSGNKGQDGYYGISTGGKFLTAGGDGGDGGRGARGQNGRRGGDAPEVVVRVTVRPGPALLLQAEITGGGRTERFLVDPAAGSLALKVRGGVGGFGGKGGRGGRGGTGGTGSSMGRNGKDGQDGAEGAKGKPGAAGAITIVYDPLVKPHLGRITITNQDGEGDPGPAPVFREEPVAPLW
jgi:hypothetical protein